MNLHSESSKLAYTKLRLEAGEQFPQEEVDRVVEFFTLATISYGYETEDKNPQSQLALKKEEGLVAMFRLAQNHPQVTQQFVIDTFLDNISKKEHIFAAYNAAYLIRYILENHLCCSETEKSVWIERLYQFLYDFYDQEFGRYDPLPLTALNYLNTEQQAHLLAMHKLSEGLNKKIPRITSVSELEPTYKPPQYSPEEYQERIKKCLADPIHGLHDAWVLAHNHKKFEDAIHYLKQKNSYLSLLRYATGGYKDDKLSGYDYSAFFTQEEINQLYEDGVSYYINHAEELRQRDGEKNRDNSGYWKYELIAAGCLERDRGRYEQAADLFDRGGQTDRAASLAILHNLPRKNDYVKAAVELGFYEKFLPLLKEIDLDLYNQTLEKIETKLPALEEQECFEYCAKLCLAMADDERARVYAEASKYFEAVNVI